MQKIKATMLVLLALTMSGCGLGSGDAEPPQWTLPLVVSSAATACPGADAAARHEFARTVAAPVPDTTDPATGKPMVSLGLLKKKTDELRTAVARKNQTGQRIIREGDRCSGVEHPVS